MSLYNLTLLILTLLLPTILSLGNVEFNKYELDSNPKALLWCGSNNQITIVLTEESSVYRSEDRGLHWKKLNEIFTTTGKEELEEKENEIGLVSVILQSPADKNTLIFLGTKGINWVGLDCGQKIQALNHGRRINEFFFHPTEPTWGLASAFTLCEDFVSEPCKLFKEIYVTTDLGQNWKLIGSYVLQFGWGITGQEHINKGIPKKRIFMTHEPFGQGDQRNIGWNYKIDFVYSDDFFETKKVLVSKGNKFLLTNDYLFVAEVVDQETQEVVLLGANSTVSDYDFHPIQMNQQSFSEHSYTFLDTSLHSVFLHVNHFGSGSYYGHIYISGPRGLRYSLSLKNNIRTVDDQCDFEKVNSVEGVYLANMISGKYIKIVNREMAIESAERKESMGKETAVHDNKSAHTKSNQSYKDYIKSMITFNKGGDWKRLIAPERDSTGKRYDCGKYCYLNLFGLGSEYSHYYSVDSAAGIIIGNGNVGHYLSKENVATFLSRDGGLNWFEIRKGSHIYEIGDHGGLIIIADEVNPTNTIQYTWDEGLTWEELRISEDKFMVKNIIIEPSSASHNFMVYGETFKNGTKKGVIVGMDFGNVYPQCRDPTRPDTANSDYEKWSPNDGRTGRQCLLGHKTTIVRRKREAHCVNNESFQRKTFEEHCECTEDDYQCDIGYGRNEPGEPCTKLSIRGGEEEIHKPPANCDKVYYISRGYRRIPGNTCINGVKYDPIALPCPYSTVWSALKYLFYIGVVIIIGAFVYLSCSSGGCSLDGLWSYITSMIPNVAHGGSYMNYGQPKMNYADLSGGDEDNTLFEEYTKILNPIQSKKKKGSGDDA